MLSDLCSSDLNWNKTPGYTEAETQAFAKILTPPEDAVKKDEARPMIDTWRNMHPETRHYTYFSYRFNCREKGLGWRLDTCELSWFPILFCLDMVCLATGWCCDGCRV